MSDVKPETLDQPGLHRLIDEIQQNVADLDRLIADAYFFRSAAEQPAA